jgi:UDP-N-acetylmuramoylalanine--D-glutamate ligase
MTHKPDFRGKKVTVVGLGIEGVDLVRYLVGQGAQVTASDIRTADRLAPRLRELDGLPVRLSLGANDPADTVDADMVFVSQSVPLDIPALTAARERGVPMSSMMRLFLDLCPGPVIGITGSSGKTTVTSLVGAMLAAAGMAHLVGGNIGVGLLSLLDRLTAETWVVLEMSHTQLELTDKSPHVACITNVTPNHLDRYGWPQYVALKENILRYQTEADFAVLSYDNEEARSMAAKTRAPVLFFSTEGDVPADGTLLRDGEVVLRQGGRETPMMPISAIPMRGRHNVSNVLAATAVASICGAAPAAIESAVRSFHSVPHRLEFVARVDGADYYNDSIATTPERTLAGMRSFEEPLVLLLGGREKHLPLEEMSREMCQRCRAAVFFGEAGEALGAAARAACDDAAPEKCFHMETVATLSEAVAAARAAARPGDVVLLSPACTSFDAYNSFEERGAHFRRLVLALPGAKGER